MPHDSLLHSMLQGEAAGDSKSGRGPEENVLHGMDTDPENAFGHLRRGTKYMLIGMIDRAIRDFDIAIRIDPENPRAFTLRATAHAAKQNYDKAIADFTTAIRLSPRDCTAWIGRANVHAMLNREEKAMKDMAVAMRLE